MTLTEGKVSQGVKDYLGAEVIAKSSILGNNALSASLELRFLITREKSFLSITTPFKEGWLRN